MRLDLDLRERQHVRYVFKCLQQHFRIYVIAILLRPEVQCRRTAGVAFATQTYRLALADVVALRHAYLTQIRIGRRDSACVRNGHKEAVIRHLASERDGPLTRRPHRCAGRHSVVDPSVARTKLVGRRFKFSSYLGVYRCYEWLAGG